MLLEPFDRSQKDKNTSGREPFCLRSRRCATPAVVGELPQFSGIQGGAWHGSDITAGRTASLVPDRCRIGADVGQKLVDGTFEVEPQLYSDWKSGSLSIKQFFFNLIL